MPSPGCKWIIITCSCRMIVGRITVCETIGHDEIHYVRRGETLKLRFSDSTPYERKIVRGAASRITSHNPDRFRSCPGCIKPDKEPVTVRRRLLLRDCYTVSDDVDGCSIQIFTVNEQHRHR